MQMEAKGLCRLRYLFEGQGVCCPEEVLLTSGTSSLHRQLLEEISATLSVKQGHTRIVPKSTSYSPWPLQPFSPRGKAKAPRAAPKPGGTRSLPSPCLDGSSTCISETAWHRSRARSLERVPLLARGFTRSMKALPYIWGTRSHSCSLPLR